jgi:hypothetical protein
MKRKPHKTISIINYIFFLIIVVVLCDVVIFHKILDMGYPRHYKEENILHYPAPYEEFTGSPQAKLGGFSPQ